MRRSTVIAKCLVNSGFANDEEQGEWMVRRDFQKEFPDLSFDEWNVNMYDDAGNNIIRNVGRASMINTKEFIKELAGWK